MVVELVAEQRLIPVDVALECFRIRIEQELLRVAPQPSLRLVRTMHAEAIALTWPDVGEVTVPDERVPLGQAEPGLLALVVVQAQIDAVGNFAEDGEVRAAPVVRRPKR